MYLDANLLVPDQAHLVLEMEEAIDCAVRWSGRIGSGVAIHRTTRWGRPLMRKDHVARAARLAKKIERSMRNEGLAKTS